MCSMNANALEDMEQFLAEAWAVSQHRWARLRLMRIAGKLFGPLSCARRNLLALISTVRTRSRKFRHPAVGHGTLSAVVQVK